jgi:S-adenosylmethionine hydrolase
MSTGQSELPPTITLTTDFGLTDSYVAQIKGVIIGISPRARIVDISHGVLPQQIRQATFLTQAAWPCFPSRTIHVAVVDPGVGRDRRSIVLHTQQGVFVGPDNGVLSAAYPDDARPDEPHQIPLPDGVNGFEISNPRYMREPVSKTFHGRDVFAPAAAHLALGIGPEELGEPLQAVMALPPIQAVRHADGTFEAKVVHIDRFGNVISDIRSRNLPTGGFTVKAGGQTMRGPFGTYAELDGPGALVGSSGYLELAAPNANAASLLDLEIGAPVTLQPDE